MTSSVRSTSRGAATLLASFAVGCLGPNPLLDAGEAGTESETGDGDGDTGDGDGDTGDGDGDTGDGDGDTGDGDGDGDPADTCQNNMLDGDETDVDCGGSCLPCDDGLACLQADDCDSMVCEDASCQAPSCDDDVANGTELDVDCGGDCSFCEHSLFQTELDNFEGSPASFPHVEMFGDAGFALTYHGPPGARIRWFDALAEAETDQIELSEDIILDSDAPIPFAIDADADDERIHALETGLGPMSQSQDMFLLQRDPAEQFTLELVDTDNALVRQGDITVAGNTATVAWLENSRPYLRRYDYSIGDGSWADINPFDADEGGNAEANNGISIARNAEGMHALAWVRCDAPGCEVVARRFDNMWVDPAPVVLSGDEMGSFFYIFPQIAFADDGRAFVAWFSLDIGMSDLRVRMLDEDFIPVGDPWTVQTLPVAEQVGVAALSDGSFALAWADRDQGRLHLRRYIGPETLKNPNFPDEAPWDNLVQPSSVSAATIDNRLVVAWSATVDMVSQVQGQILSF